MLFRSGLHSDAGTHSVDEGTAVAHVATGGRRHEPHTRDIAAADDVGGVLYQRIKRSVGADGSATDFLDQKTGTDTYTTTVAGTARVLGKGRPTAVSIKRFQLASPSINNFRHISELITLAPGKAALPKV